MKADEYAILEFSGFVVGKPSERKGEGIVRFPLMSPNGALLPMMARDSAATALKGLIHRGSLIQGKAIPRQSIKEVGGEHMRLTEWEIAVIGAVTTKRRSIAKFEDLEYLDAMMPSDGEYIDVYPEGRYLAERNAKARELAEESLSRLEKDLMGELL